MKQFFKFMFASCLGSAVAMIFSGIILIMIISGIISALVSTTSTDVAMKDNSVLVIDLSDPIYDREVNDMSSIISMDGVSSKMIGLSEFIKVMDKAKKDDRIKAVMLDVSTLQANGYATAQEMREVLKDFASSGKKIYAYSDGCDQKSYYIATVADRIAVNPAGMVTLSGMGAEVMYIKDLADKMDVDVDLIRPAACAFKSAGEMYTMNHMSDSNREQTRVYLASIWNSVSKTMASARKIEISKFNSIVDNLNGMIPSEAVSSHIIDYTCFRSDFKDSIQKYVAAQYKMDKKDKLNFIRYSSYRDMCDLDENSSSDKIAVVYAYGDVKQGKGSDVSIGSETTCKAIREAAEDKSVKAIVLRVNSPGGDAVASELITNEVIKAKKAKPVIVSMGDYAASAGYEMSSNASYIVADETTLTGSIGVFGVMPNFARTLKNKIGVSFDTVKISRNANPISVTVPMTKDAKMLMYRNVDNFYANFVNRVATGRNKTPQYIASIAKGRVWTGTDALKLGLVDEIGGLNKAIKIAATKAGLKDYGIIAYPEPKSFVEQFMDDTETEAKMKKFTSELGKPYSFFLQLRDICMMQGVQMRLPYIISM